VNENTVTISPENFPETKAALGNLLSTIQAETTLYCLDNKVLLNASPSVANGVLMSMIAVLMEEQKRFQKAVPPHIEERHFFVGEDGVRRPLEAVR